MCLSLLGHSTISFNEPIEKMISCCRETVQKSQISSKCGKKIAHEPPQASVVSLLNAHVGL